MSWRYMAARETTDSGEVVWTIHEVYETSDGTGWTARAVAPTGSTHAELREALRMMAFEIEHRDYLDLDAGVVAHRPGGLRADLMRSGGGPLQPVLDADGPPAVTTVGDLTARHIGRRVRVEGREGHLERLDCGWIDGRDALILDLDSGVSWANLDLDTPCEVLP